MFEKIKGMFKRTTYGTYVEVFLDRGFGRIEPCHEPEMPPKDWAKRGKAGIVRVMDAGPEEVKEKLSNRQFDWGTIHSHTRYYIEIKGYHEMSLKQVLENLG